MTSIENIGIGIARYIDGELASKTDGLKKWGLSLASVLIVAKITEMTTRYSDVLKSAGYMNENGMVDVVRLKERCAREGRGYTKSAIHRFVHI